MRLNRYVLDLYFDSVDGRDLMDSLAILRAGWSAWHRDGESEVGSSGGAGEVGSESTEADTIAPEESQQGDEGEVERESDEEEEATGVDLEAALALLFEEDFLDESSMALLRTLKERGAAVPSNLDEARSLYESVLSEGVSLESSDGDAVLALVDALEQVDAEEGAEEEAPESQDGGTNVVAPEPSAVDDEGAADSSTDLADEDGEDAGSTDTSLGIRLDGEECASNWVRRVAGISWGLHCFAPELFVPYLFRWRFHQFEAICAELEIPLPRLPGKSSASQRAMYYFEVNAALQEFRAEHGLTPDELNSLLYGFATRAVPVEEVDPLPDPARVWHLLGSPDDAAWLDSAGDDARSHWQGGYDIRPGDICVMWCRSPRSYVHSIWRATSSGFADPFFYYYRTVWIAKRIKVPNIKFAEIQADPVWSQKPAVRAHFQNSSGKEITRAEYDALLGMFAKTGFDTSVLPKLQEVALGLDAAELERESDVEQKLLEPLLEKLGFKKKDWRRQLPLRMGRGIRVYPDYVLGLRGERGDESARAIIEAKLRIRGPRDLDEAFSQAASYAARLRADVLGLCAAEGLWLYTRESGRFRRTTSYELRWADTGDPTHLRRLSELLGGRV